MANPEHLARLGEGVKPWNAWRGQNRNLEPNLSSANLSGLRFKGANLRKADLRQANLNEADLSWTNLSGANLGEADLSGARLTKAALNYATVENANLSGANLSEAHLGGTRLGGARLDSAQLNNADLTGADLHNADLTSVELRFAHLNRANLYEANLSMAVLRNANLRGANLRNAILTGADLRSASLQDASLMAATLTDVKLWEAQRAGWHIKDIVCERAFWDKDAKEAIAYVPGEFERLYSEQTCIELFYQGGVSTFELNTLPALLQHLASIHSGSNIRLKSIEETGGGARISISVGDADSETAEKIKADALQVYQAQLVLRERETERLQIEKSYLETLFLGRLIPAMLSAGTPQNVFNAPVTGLVLAGNDSKIDFRQTVNDNSALITLLERMIDRRADLTLPAPAAAQLETELHAARDELQKQNPDRSALAKSIQFIQKLAGEALAHAADKLGEQAISGDWSGWLHQLGQFVSHLG
jgi:uncharacterized protein YjbI with pentapeptide repeats